MSVEHRARPAMPARPDDEAGSPCDPVDDLAKWRKVMRAKPEGVTRHRHMCGAARFPQHQTNEEASSDGGLRPRGRCGGLYPRCREHEAAEGDSVDAHPLARSLAVGQAAAPDDPPDQRDRGRCRLLRALPADPVRCAKPRSPCRARAGDPRGVFASMRPRASPARRSSSPCPSSMRCIRTSVTTSAAPIDPWTCWRKAWTAPCAAAS